MTKTKNLRSVLFIVTVLAMILLLAGCHGSRGISEFEMPEEFYTSRDYEITFWAKNDTNKIQTAIYEKAIDDFQKLYPNIKVNLRLYTDYGRIYNDVITNIATNTTPNVCITYPDHIATYMTGNNVVVSLDELFENSKYGFGGSELNYDSPRFDEVVSKFLDECRIGESYYGIPYMRSTEACYINKTYVEKMGYTLPEVLTWDFVWEVSDAAMAKDDDGNYIVNGQKIMIPFIYKSTDNMMIQMLKQKDAGYSTSDGEILLFMRESQRCALSVRQVDDGRHKARVDDVCFLFVSIGLCTMILVASPDGSNIGEGGLGLLFPFAQTSGKVK